MAEKIIKEFVNLHLHTEHSLLDGASRVKDVVARAKEMGQTAVGITDHGVLYGALEMYQAAKAEAIKPILGCEMYVAPGSRFDKARTISDDGAGGTERGKEYAHLVVIAKNQKGWSNLIKLSSKASLEGFYQKPRVDHELLTLHHEGLIILSGCLGGAIPQAILKGDMKEAERLALYYKETFGDDFFLELQNHQIPEETQVRKELALLGKKLGIPIIATDDSHYTWKEDSIPHEAMLAINVKKNLTELPEIGGKQNRFHFSGPNYYLKSGEEMGELFQEYPEAIENTVEVARRCQVDFELNVNRLPKFSPIPEGIDDNEYLSELAFKGLKERVKGNVTNEMKERLKEELGVIGTQGFASYFLIVSDYVNAAKCNGVRVGPGRGSAAGSLVAYALGITNLEPIKYGLIFERFLNKERFDMPDIDIDFDNRNMTIAKKYVEEKYGKDKVCQIITFGTFGAKASIRDICRVLAISIPDANRLAKLIPNAPGTTLDQALEQVKEFRMAYQGEEIVIDDGPIVALIEEDVNKWRKRRARAKVAGEEEGGEEGEEEKVRAAVEEGHRHMDSRLVGKVSFEIDAKDGLEHRIRRIPVKMVIDLAKKVEGLSRSAGTHAAAVVIAAEPLTDVVPIQRPTKEGAALSAVTQFDMHGIHSMGLLKMDFLGLKNLNVIGDAIENIKKIYGIEIDENSIPVDDPPTYELLCRGDTYGVFQCEGAGGKRVVIDLQPKCLEDMSAAIALNRPGPLDSGLTASFIARRQGREPISYDLPELEEAMKDTYGVSIYQEQVMRIAQIVAGYTMGEADILRSAMGKKIKEKMAKERRKFIEGAKIKGHDEAFSSELFDKLAHFADYGFNLSHSVCYGYIGYQTAYLKANFPREFMCALLTMKAEGNTPDKPKVMECISDCQERGLQILLPDVNVSDSNFSVEPKTTDGIRFGLTHIKAVGSAAEKIVEARNKGGEFVSLLDLKARVPTLRRNELEALIRGGACDSFGERAQMMAALERIIKRADSLAKERASGQNDLFSSMNNVAVDAKGKPRPTISQQREFLAGGGIVTEAFPLPEGITPATKKERLEWEKELLGTYVSGHPLDDHTDRLKECSDHTIASLGAHLDGKDVQVAGILRSVTKFIPKRSTTGQAMARIEIEDKTGICKGLVFAKTYEKVQNLVKTGGIVALSAKVGLDTQMGGTQDTSERDEESEEEEEESQPIILKVNSVLPLNSPYAKIRSGSLASNGWNSPTGESRVQNGQTKEEQNTSKKEEQSNQKEVEQGAPPIVQEKKKETEKPKSFVRMELKEGLTPQAVELLKGVIKEHGGEYPVVLQIRRQDGVVDIVNLPVEIYGISPNSDTALAIEKVLGPGSFSIRSAMGQSFKPAGKKIAVPNSENENGDKEERPFSFREREGEEELPQRTL